MNELERKIINLPATLQEWEAYTDGWLANRRLSDHTREAYRRALSGWLGWCDRANIDPIAATTTFVHVNTYARHLEERLSPASVNQHLSGISSWYEFLAKIDAVPGKPNPVDGADRPRVSRDHSTTIGLSGEEVDALLAAATPGRDQTILTLMADLGLRVSEVVNLNIEDLVVEQNKPVVRYTGKGGVKRRRAIPRETWWMLAAVIGGRTEGPLFVRSRTGNRLDRHELFRLIRETARQAGIPSWADLSPHSLRHAFATAARDEGVPLEDVQDAMGHADPRTTRRYDRDRHNLDRDPSIALEAARVKRRSEVARNETPTGRDGS